MARKLKRITLDELSIVDVPACQGATIALFKRDGYKDKKPAEKAGDYDEANKGGSGMDPKELAEKLESLEGQNADLTKRLEAAEAETAALKKAADEAGFDVADGKIVKRAEIEYIEFDGERIEKSAVPAALLKALEAKDAALADLRKKDEEVALAKRGETELPNLAGTALTKGKLLAVADAEMIATLKAADAAMKKAMEEVGHNKTDETTATERLNKMAQDYADKNGVTFHKAYAEVIKTADGMKLVGESRDEAK
jgi:hypothetical protein